MTRLGFHASHEQIDPRRLLADVQAAERAGFDMGSCSDHIAPWSRAQGHSGNAWTWLGAALATTDLELGCVCAPGQRYHPAIVAHQLATLGQMFPGRAWTALGSGEAVNEVITGEAWPRKEVRVRRLEECVDVIRRLLDGEEVSHDGLITVNAAQLWERPDPAPKLIGPAISPESAGRVAAWADGLLTVNQDIEVLKRVVGNFRDAGGTGTASLQVHLSWAPTEEEAEAIAYDQWRTNVFRDPVLADTETVAGFEAAAEFVRPADVRRSVRISADPAQHVAWIREYAELGFEDIYLHYVGQDHTRYLDTFAADVLPHAR